MILGTFLDFAEEGDNTLANYLLHCGIDSEDIRDAAPCGGCYPQSLPSA
jgi:hypothetical protein